MHNTPSKVNTDQVHSPFCLRISMLSSAMSRLIKRDNLTCIYICYFSEQGIDFKIQDFKTSTNGFIIINHYQLSILLFLPCQEMCQTLVKQ